MADHICWSKHARERLIQRFPGATIERLSPDVLQPITKSVLRRIEAWWAQSRGAFQRTFGSRSDREKWRWHDELGALLLIEQLGGKNVVVTVLGPVPSVGKLRQACRCEPKNTWGRKSRIERMR